MTRLNIPAVLLTGALLGNPWLAQAQTANPHAGHAPPTTPPANAATVDSPSTAAYMAANAKMHEGMSIAFTGDADRDFLAGMIAHHQGAIDMSEVVIQYGKDPKIRQLAQEIIRAQKAEITQMQTWLKAMDSQSN